MTSDKVLAQALTSVRLALKAKGFKHKGRLWYQQASGANIILLSVQKGRKSSTATSYVTINYGVYSVKLGAKLGEEYEVVPDISRAHWNKRILEDGKEKWLRVDARDAPERVAEAIHAALAAPLMELAAHASDEALRDEWLSGRSPGLVETQRLLYLAIILSEIGPYSAVGGVVTALERQVAGRPQEAHVVRQLASAGIKSQ